MICDWSFRYSAEDKSLVSKLWLLLALKSLEQVWKDTHNSNIHVTNIFNHLVNFPNRITNWPLWWPTLLSWHIVKELHIRLTHHKSLYLIMHKLESQQSISINSSWKQAYNSLVLSFCLMLITKSEPSSFWAQILKIVEIAEGLNLEWS